jgi:hypothetical protein
MSASRNRKKPTLNTEEAVLTKSARRCALCYGLDGNLRRRRGQIAHIDHDRTNSTEDNLGYLCFDHHDEYDSTTSQSKGITPREFRNHRDRLYEAIARGGHHDCSNRPMDGVSSEVRSHDQQAFRAGDAILSEDKLYDIRRNLSDNHMFFGNDGSAIRSFIAHYLAESNRFVLEDILEPLDELLKALSALNVFMIGNFFFHPSNHRDDRGALMCMHPNLNIDRGGGHTAEERQRYQDYAEKLDGIIEKVAEAFAEYRRTVKRTLLV